MVRKTYRMWASMALLMGLALSGSVRAECPDSEKKLYHGHCPKGSYSHLHYWTPCWFRFKYHFTPKSVSSYAEEKFPGLTPTYESTRFRCPPVPPPSFPSAYDRAGDYR